MSFLDLLGIHEYDILIAKDRIWDVLEEINCDTNDLVQLTCEKLVGEEITEDMGNQIIAAMLEAGKEIATDYARGLGYENLEIETYCNGADSRFSINQDDIDILNAINDLIVFPGIDVNTIIWLHKNLLPRDFDEIIRSAECGQLLSILNALSEDERDQLGWESYEECGLTDSEIDEREKAMMSDPDDHSKIFFMTPEGQIWSMMKE